MPAASLGVGGGRAHEGDGAQAERGDADGQDEVRVEEGPQWGGRLVAGAQHAHPEQQPAQGPSGGGDGEPPQTDHDGEGDQPAGQDRLAGHLPDENGHARHQERADDEVDDPGDDTRPDRGRGEPTTRPPRSLRGEAGSMRRARVVGASALAVTAGRLVGGGAVGGCGGIGNYAVRAHARGLRRIRGGLRGRRRPRSGRGAATGVSRDRHDRNLLGRRDRLPAGWTRERGDRRAMARPRRERSAPMERTIASEDSHNSPRAYDAGSPELKT